MKLLQDAMVQYTTGMKGRAFPPCFKGVDEYQYWLEAEGESGAETKGLRKWVCRDCSTCFQTKNKAKGTCLIPTIPVEKLVERRRANDFDVHLYPWEELESSKEAFAGKSLYTSMFDVVMGVVSE